jgi:transposase InsO family protein
MSASADAIAAAAAPETIPTLPAPIEEHSQAILPPAVVASPPPLGQPPVLIKKWFDGAVIASIPDHDGTLGTARIAAEAYARHAKADNTRRAYRAGVRAWCDWCHTHALPCLPAHAADVVAFLAAERGSGLSVTTVELRRAAIRYHTGRRRTRAHDGKVVTLRSNVRWCSDTLEFTCWNGDLVRVAFALDCHDREVLGWVATTAGISGEMIRDLMIECVESRFAAPRTPHPVQWLADNGSVYAAAKTIDIATALNLQPCFTPVAFVKTLKRDYVRVSPIPDAQAALAAVSDWMTDYNEVHPHSRLAYHSPKEYIKTQPQPAVCPV